MKSKSANNDTCSTGVAMTTESEPTRCDGSCCSSAAVMSGSFLLLLLFLLHQTFDSFCFSLGYRADSESDVKRTETKSGGDALALLYTSAVQHNNVSVFTAQVCPQVRGAIVQCSPVSPAVPLTSCRGASSEPVPIDSYTCTMMSHGVIQSADLW